MSKHVSKYRTGVSKISLQRSFAADVVNRHFATLAKNLRDLQNELMPSDECLVPPSTGDEELDQLLTKVYRWGIMAAFGDPTAFPNASKEIIAWRERHQITEPSPERGSGLTNELIEIIRGGHPNESDLTK